MSDYDNSFYDTIRPGVVASAKAVVPIVLKELKSADIAVTSVVDVGCGEGWWAYEFTKHGIEDVVGIDGDYVDGGPAIPRLPHDLSKPLDGIVVRRFDLAVCLEVAEHLPEKRAASFVSDIVGIAPTVLFSAAMPRQGGTGHVNCQPPQYWADLFASYGYGCQDTIRKKIWDSPDVEPWYKSNILLFSARFDTDDRPEHIAHPDLWLE